MHAMNSFDKNKRQPILTDADLIAVSEEISLYFPRPITETLLTLMEVDPYTIHAYWNIEPASTENIRHIFSDDALEGVLTLRVHTKSPDIKDRGEDFLDCAIRGMEGSTYLNVTPQTLCIAEIGFLLSDGNFWILATSNAVRTPPGHPSIQRPVRIDRADNGVPPHQTMQTAGALMSPPWSVSPTERGLGRASIHRSRR